ncbi:MAG: hypothetical protein RL571_3155 [Pseudomonadota bacterium]|jgi:LysR family transcriptional regulator AphB
MLDDLALFVTVVEAGSLSAAAQKMSLPAATLTRRLQKLEQQLGCRLLNRSARRIQVTREGRQYTSSAAPYCKPCSRLPRPWILPSIVWQV